MSGQHEILRQFTKFLYTSRLSDSLPQKKDFYKLRTEFINSYNKEVSSKLKEEKEKIEVLKQKNKELEYQIKNLTNKQVIHTNNMIKYSKENKKLQESNKELNKQVNKLVNSFVSIQKENAVLRHELKERIRCKSSELIIGKDVLYEDKISKKFIKCKIISIDNTVISEEPYYTIQFENGNERQTEINRLYSLNR